MKMFVNFFNNGQYCHAFLSNLKIILELPKLSNEISVI